MAQGWHPSICPPGRRCDIALVNGVPSSAKSLCPHHRGLLDGGMTEPQVLDAIAQSSRVNEAARWALKLHMGLDKEHPGLPFTVAADGSISIQSGLTGQARNAARSAVATAVLAVRRPNGTSAVTVD